LKKLHRLFIEKDLSLIEINPLGIRQNDALIALDARITADDNALFRQSKMAALGSRSASSSAEQIALREGFNYVSLDGNVGIFSSGAGLAMATVDAVANCGARPANFLDVPPVLEVSRVKQAFLLLFSIQKINCLIVNVFGAGIMRCDTIADGLLLAHLEAPVGIPIVMRLAGTNSELAISRLEKSGLPIQFVENLEAGARKIVSIKEQDGSTLTHSSWAKKAWLRIRNSI
jgi:succinyl-CoA synthetase beta subunit